jgi:dipeptidyl aminopeptidase/acylaminoacyl peptidase
MRQREYPGSEITFEEKLASGANYERYLVSYLSDGLKIYALMTIPSGEPPAGGFPVIIFNHGYIPPREYRPTERYVAYVNAFASRGYIVFRPDYRGHGDSEGEARGAYSNPDYTNATPKPTRIRLACGDIRWAGTSHCGQWSQPEM